MAPDVKLTPTSVIVLGLLELSGGGTPYELKQAVGMTVGHFWTFQHAQLYTETSRLTSLGLLSEEREQGGRRRRRYELTDAGRRALAEWRAETTDAVPELRDLALLKLFFGGDPAALGEAQAAAHRRKLAEYEVIAAMDIGAEPRGPWRALRSGLEHERQMIAFWESERDGD